jgi:phosphatidylinositol-3-phosphatase
MPRMTAWIASLLLLAAAVQAAEPNPASLPPVRHVFILILENEAFGTSFAEKSLAPYLAHELPARGVLLKEYYGIGHASLDNYLALISGQAPNDQTQLDCAVFSDFKPTAPGLDEHGQLPGSGCVYPSIVKTLPDQLEAAGLTWKAYMEDMGGNPARESATCGHTRIGEPENTHVAQVGDQYAARHDPFVFFHSIIDDEARCNRHVVNLDKLPADLTQVGTTANYTFITPNLCHDGHDRHCVDGEPAGLAAIDKFLRQWVPLIEQSAAFRQDGMLIITFDESDGVGAAGSAACCGERPLPGAKYQPGFNGPGGGRIGAVVLSPFVKPGTVSTEPYNHYSLLATIETMFKLSRLGYAGEPGLRLFGADVFSGDAPHPPAR